MTDSTPPPIPNKPNTVARALFGVLIVQLGLGVLLVLGDLRGNFALPGARPDKPELTEPIRPGDQTRRFQPGNAPPGGRPFPASPLPERLVLTDLEGAALLEGGIAEGDADRIIRQFDTLSPAPATIYLNSSGGSVRDALAIGRHLRAAGVDIELREDDICYSSCPYVLASGVSRTVPESASVGVHQHYYGQSTILPAFTAVHDIQRGQAEVMRYLDDMGIDTLVMQHAMATPPNEIYVLVPAELERYRFVTTGE